MLRLHHSLYTYAQWIHAALPEVRGDDVPDPSVKELADSVHHMMLDGPQLARPAADVLELLWREAPSIHGRSYDLVSELLTQPHCAKTRVETTRESNDAALGRSHKTKAEKGAAALAE